MEIYGAIMADGGASIPLTVEGLIFALEHCGFIARS